MSTGYSPQALTPGTFTQFRVSALSAGVRIQNASRYWVGVYFGADPPRGSSTSALVSGFHHICAPGDCPSIEIPNQKLSNFRQTQRDPGGAGGSTGFYGDVFLMPVTPTFLVSPTAYASLTSYDLSEPMPASTNIPGFADTGFQQRVIALPPTPLIRDIAPYVPVAGADQIIAQDPVNGGRPIPTNTPIQAYFWSILLEARTPAAGTLVGMDFFLRADTVDAGNVIINSVRFAEGTVYADSGATIGQAAYKPYALQSGASAGRINLLNPSNTAIHVNWVVHCINLFGAPNIGGSFFGYTDQANELFPGIYGDGAEAAQGSF